MVVESLKKLIWFAQLEITIKVQFKLYFSLRRGEKFNLKYTPPPVVHISNLCLHSYLNQPKNLNVIFGTTIGAPENISKIIVFIIFSTG